jgi:hypothetical protein
MNNTVPSPRDGDTKETAARMRALTAELSAIGLESHVHSTQGVLDIKAVLHQPGSKDVCVIADEDGYIQISYWSAPDAAPLEVAAEISRVLKLITRSS